MRQRRGIAGVTIEARHTKWRERFAGNDPGRDRRCKTLREKRPERLILPTLDVARRPIVHQAHAEHMLAGFFNWNPGAERVASPDDAADFALVIHLLRRREDWRALAGLELAMRALDFRSTDNDRRGTSVIADGNVFVIWQQRVIGAEHAADVGRVKDGGVEIGVVANVDGHE